MEICSGLEKVHRSHRSTRSRCSPVGGRSRCAKAFEPSRMHALLGARNPKVCDRSWRGLPRTRTRGAPGRALGARQAWVPVMKGLTKIKALGDWRRRWRPRWQRPIGPNLSAGDSMMSLMDQKVSFWKRATELWRFCMQPPPNLLIAQSRAQRLCLASEERVVSYRVGKRVVHRTM